MWSPLGNVIDVCECHPNIRDAESCHMVGVQQMTSFSIKQQFVKSQQEVRSLTQSQQMFSVKDHTVNIFVSTGHMVSLTTIQLC